VSDSTLLLSQDIQEFIDRYQCNPVLAELLIRKGITNPNQVKFFMEKKHLHYVHNPFLLPDMHKALDVIDAIEKKQGSVMVFGDKDVDGVTSTALLVNFLRACGIHTQYCVPEENDRYGMSKEHIQTAIESGIDGIFAVDCGSTQLEEIEYARSHGLFVVVIDHHDLRSELPRAHAIINPKIEGSVYPCAQTCACALVSKLVFAYHLNRSEFFTKEILLFHSAPGNGIHLYAAYRLCYGVVQERLHGVYDLDSPDAALLQAYQRVDAVVVYNEEQQTHMLAVLQAHKKQPVVSLQKEMKQSMTEFSRLSIGELLAHTRSKRYIDQFEEIDMIHALYTFHSFQSEESARQAFINTLDLTALALIADLVDLRDENRILLHHGLGMLTRQAREAIGLLYEKKLIELPLDELRLPWTLIPTLNSSGRMGKAGITVKFFLDNTELVEKKRLLASMSTLNKKRKTLYEFAMKKHYTDATESLQSLDNKCIIVTGESIHRGITGIVANRYAEAHSRPCICISIGDVESTGSVRSIDMFDTPKFLEQFSSYLIGWGGHRAAGGFSLYTKQLDSLLAAMERYIKYELILESPPTKDDPDCILSQENLTPDIMQVLAECRPFGKEFRNPLFQIDELTVVDVKYRGDRNQHLLLTVEGGGYKWNAVYWNAEEEATRALLPQRVVGVLCDISLNVYRSQETIQLKIHKVLR